LKLLETLIARLKPGTLMAPAAAMPALDARVGKTIHDALASAGLDRRAAHANPVAGIIDDALTQAGLLRPALASAATPIASRPAPTVSRAVARGWPTQRVPDVPSPGEGAGEFLTRSFAGDAGAHAYKLYVPAGYSPDSTRLFPLVVMLHGCTQSPDDFAAGTRMNALADEHGLLVAYPAQSANANGSKCWNWFRPQDQARGAGEPALIAGITGEIVSQHRVDASRVYVAGLSAGAAMAVILGRTYPDLYAAVGAHSGLPYRAAHDVATAFTAMKGGSVTGGRHDEPRATGPGRQGVARPTPTIVFHGDRDHTVKPSNSAAIAAQVSVDGKSPTLHSSQEGVASGGRTYTRMVYHDASGKTVVEQWRVHGAGHAWMGGSAKGTDTDPQGPDASAEMLRFFLQHST
jgi:poly(hydroxyalkanoate) depolymerase family esterase